MPNKKTKNSIVLHDDYAVIFIGEKQAKISLSDVDYVSQHNWNADKKANGKGFYLTSYIDGRKVNLNAFLVGTKGKVNVTHFNDDDLDFRRENLDYIGSSIEIDGDIASMKIEHKGNVYYCIFDTEDVGKVLEYGKRWFVLNSGYVYSNGIYFHRFIMNAKDEEEVDHLHGNKLDNRKSELALVTPQINAQNRPAAFAVDGKRLVIPNPFTGKTEYRKRNSIQEYRTENNNTFLKLTQGKEAIIDFKDTERCTLYLWYAVWLTDGYYAATKIINTESGRLTTMYLHQYIAGTYGMGKKTRVDHINGNKLDCRNSNLRITNPSQNAQNRTSGANRNSKTGVRNVYRHESTKMLEVKVMVKGKGHYGGWFPDTEEGLRQAEEAAKALREKLHTHSDGR